MSLTHTSATLTEIADGVYAYLQQPGGWCVSNAGVLTGREATVVVDTLATEPRAVRLREAVDSLSTAARRVLVNTHHHGDHNYGNHVFGDTAVVVAHEQAVPAMTEQGLLLQALWPGAEWGEVRVALPTVTFADRVALSVGERRLEVIHLGTPAHTTNDVVGWLPAERILFAGDLAMSGVTPFVLMGSVDGSLAALDRLAALEPVTVVCGHGPLAGPEILEANAAYLRWVRQLAVDGLAAGLSPLDAARGASLGEFADLIDSERIVGNLHRAYAELRGGAPGTPLDLGAAFTEMIEFNGGRPLTCLA